jgi:uncharacterized membrane protein YhaH (DUF805 family)
MEKKNIFDYFKECYTVNYTNFDGRARRTEYWGFQLMFLVIYLGIALVLSLISEKLAAMAGLFALASFIPSIAVAIRRMHDVGKSGWFMLIPIYNLILYFTEGDHGPNEYGPDPKNPNAGNEVEKIGEE